VGAANDFLVFNFDFSSKLYFSSSFFSALESATYNYCCWI